MVQAWRLYRAYRKEQHRLVQVKYLFNIFWELHEKEV
jgi:hypothetical protein